MFLEGENGRPINFWNNLSSIEHDSIKATLNQGNIDVFGMTSGHDPDNPTEGHSAWIEYALQKNPNIIVFIAIPMIDFPTDWNQRAQEYEFNTIQQFYHYFVNDIVQTGMIDELRKEFPNTNIFTTPTGWVAKKIAQMNLDNFLLDDVEMFR